MLSQLADQPLFQIQPIDHGLHRNMLFPIQSATDLNSVIVNIDKHFALMKANLLMDFSN